MRTLKLSDAAFKIQAKSVTLMPNFQAHTSKEATLQRPVSVEHRCFVVETNAP